MMRFLVPVDGSAHAERAVSHVIRLAQAMPETEIHLVNVREPVEVWEVRRFLTEEEIAAMQQREGEEDLRTSCALLDAAGIAYKSRVLSGPIAQTIAEYARDHDCDTIVIGTHGRGGLVDLHLGSVASKVVHLARVPVTLVR